MKIRLQTIQNEKWIGIFNSNAGKFNDITKIRSGQDKKVFIRLIIINKKNEK